MNWLEQLKTRYLVTVDPLRTERRIELVAICLVALLVIQLCLGAVRLSTLSLPEPKSVADGSLLIATMNDSIAINEAQREELIARPIFWPSRRPVAPPPQAAAESKVAKTAKNAGDLKKVKLLGIFSGAGSAGVIALVDGEKKRILLNEKALEWTLTSVGPGKAVFKSGDQSQELLLAQADVAGRAADKPQDDSAKKSVKRKSAKQEEADNEIKRL